MIDPTDDDPVIEAVIETDRMSFSIGRKLNDGNYGSYDFHVSEGVRISAGHLDPERREAEFLKLVGRVEARLTAEIKRLG